MQGINKGNSQGLCKTGMEMSEEGYWKGSVLAQMLQQQYRKVCFHPEVPRPSSGNPKALSEINSGITLWGGGLHANRKHCSLVTRGPWEVFPVRCDTVDVLAVGCC